MAKCLTPRQREIYDLIAESYARLNWAPTIREIRDRTGIKSLRGVTCHLEALAKKGYIKRVAGAGRGISLVRRPEAVTKQ